MRIVFVTPRLVYPVNRGDKVRPFNFARVLSRKYELSLVSFIQSKDEIRYIETLKKWFNSVDTVFLPSKTSNLNVVCDLLSRNPLQVSYFKSSHFKQKLDKILDKEKFDLVYIFHLRMAQYLLNRNDLYRVLDLTDAVSLFIARLLKYAKWYAKPFYFLELSRLKEYEQQLMNHFEEYWIISEEDRKAIEIERRFNNLLVIPNGVDTEFFKIFRGKRDILEKKKNIIFVGYMGVESIDAIFYFHSHILPIIRKEIPEVRFFIVGANPPSRVKALTQDKNIIVTGYVKDLRDWYSKASVAIAPMRFVAGMQNKILEAMAMSLPVVTTSYGNEGINAKDGEIIFVENEPGHFAQRVIQLLKDNNLRTEIGNKARKFVEQRYSWNVVLGRIEEIQRKIEL